MSWKWNVNSTLPSTATQNTLTTRSVNLMCYLLNDTTFEELYDEPAKRSLRKICANLANLPDYLKVDAYDRDWNTSELENHLSNILRILESAIPGERPVKARDFLHNTYNAPSSKTRKQYDILQELRALRARRDLYHFCLPFMTVQDTEVIVPGDIVDKFVKHLRYKTLFHLFTEPKSSYTIEQLHAIQDAKDHGILKVDLVTEEIDGEIHLTSINLRNKHKCIAGKCSDGYPDSWCNAGSDNSCSAVSD